MRQSFRFLNISPLFAAAWKHRQRRLRKLGRQELRLGVEAVEGRAMLAGSDLSSVTPDLITADDTGYDGRDNYTNKTSVSISLNVGGINFAAGESVQLFVNGTFQGARPVGVGTGNVVTFTGVTLAAEGNNQVTARAFDAAGPGTVSASLNITLDTIAPKVLSGAPFGQTAVSYSTGSYYEFQVAFDELVYTSNRTAVNGGTAPADTVVPVLPIVVGTWFNNDSPRQDKTAELKALEGRGSTTLVFRHQVALTDSNDADGVEIFATTGGNANTALTKFLGQATVVDRAGNALGDKEGDHTDTIVMSVSQTGAAAGQGFLGVIDGEHRVTPVSSVTLTILNASFPVFIDGNNNNLGVNGRYDNVGVVNRSDFVLTRDGVPVNISGATLSWPVGAGVSFQRFQLGNLQQYTNEPGAYTLTFQDLGVIPQMSVSWVKSISTSGEIIARMTPTPAAGSPRTVAVSKVDVQFQDNAGAAMPVVGVVNAVGTNVTQFRMYRNGEIIPAPELQAAGVTVNGSGASYTVSNLSKLQTVSGSYELELPQTDAITSIPSSNSTTGDIKLITTYSASWQYVKPAVLNVAVEGGDKTYRAGENINFTVSYSDGNGNAVPVAVTGVPTLGLNIGGAIHRASYVAGNGTELLTFSYTVKAGDVDDDGIDFTDASVQLFGGATITHDGIDATATFSAPDLSGVLVDAVRPVLNSVTAPIAKTYIVGNKIRYEVTFSEPMTVTGTPQIKFTLGSDSKFANYVSGSGTAVLVFEYTVVVGNIDADGIESGTTIDLNGGTIADRGGNTVLTLVFGKPDTSGVLVDGVAPAVTAAVGPGVKTYAIGEVLRYEVSFDDAVRVDTTSGVPGISVTVGSTVRSARYVSGSGTAVLVFEYAVQPGDSDTDGVGTTANVQLNGGKITDPAGNTASVTFTAPDTSKVLVDGVRPMIGSVTPPVRGNYMVAETVRFVVQFTEPVVVDITGGTPGITFIAGSTSKSAAYVSGSGSNSLVFEYLVQVGDLDNDGIVASSAVALNGGLIRDLPGNAPSTLVFSAIDTSEVYIDGIRPVLQTVTPPAPKTYVIGEIIRYTVAFSEPMAVVGTPSIAFTLGYGSNTAKEAAYVSGSGTAVLVFEYTIQPGDLDTDGIVSSTVIKLNAGGAITDSAGNPTLLSFAAVNTSAVLVDGVAPTVTRFGSTKANGTYTIGAAIPITAVMSEAVQAGSSIDVTLDTGAIVTLTAATQGRNLVGTYVVAADENSGDLTATSFDDVNLLDVAGNPLGNTNLPTGLNNIAGAKNLKIDTVFPDVPTVDSQVTRNTKPTLTGTANPGVGERLSVAVNGATYGNVPVTGGFWSLDLASAVPTSGTLRQFVDGVYSVTAALIDAASNTSLDTSSGELTVDTTAPAVPTVNTLVTNNRLPTITGTAALLPGEILFVSVNGATYPVTPGGTAWSLDLAAAGAIPLVDGSYPVYATVQDPAGNISNDLTTNEVAIDNVQPTIAIGSSASKLKAGETAAITFTLSKPSIDFVAGDVTVANGTIGSFSGSGSVYTAVFTPTAGTKALGAISVAAARFKDAAGNDNVASAVTTIESDTVVPTVEIDSDADSLRTGQTATIMFVTSKPTTDFTNSDITVSGLIKIPGTFVAVSSTVYQVQVRPTGSSTAAGVVSVGQGRFVDDYGNGNAAATISPSITIDTVAPTVTITTSKTALRAGETATITFVLSESSTDFTLSDINAYGGQVSNLAGSGTVYTAIFTPSQNSTVPGMVTVAALQFTDSIGNSNIAGALPTPMQIDTIVPTVAVGSSASALKAGETATITFVLSEPSTTFDAGDVTAVGGVISGFVGSGMNYSAIYTPNAGFQGFGTVMVNAGAFTDAAGNANLAGALASAIVIDTLAPGVIIASSASDLRSGQSATITFTVSEPTNSFTGLGGVTAVGGTLGAFTKISSTVYTALFTPTTNSLVSGGVSLAAGAFSDLAGNGNTAASLLPRIAIDTQTPTVLVTSSKTKLKTGETATISFTLSENSTTFGLASLTPVGGTLSSFKGAGANYSVTFTPTVNYTGLGNVLIAAGAFTDDAGNGNIAGGLATAMSVDTLAPDAPVIMTVYDDVAPVIGSVASGGSTNDPSLLISGSSEAGATVTITSGATAVGTVVADRNGRWAVTTKPLADGKYSFVTSAVDSNGNVGLPSTTPYLVNVDTVAPDVAAILGVTDDKQPVVGTVPLNGPTNDSVLVISGTASAGSMVTLRSGALTIGTTTASFDGTWTLTTPALADGVYAFVAVASDDAGNAAKGSAPYGVTVDTVAPTTPVILSVEDDAGPVVGRIDDGGVTDDATPTVIGEAEAGSTVILLNNGTYVTAAIADANGRFAMTTPALANGVTARFALLGQDRAGNVSDLSSPPFSVSIDTVAAKVAALSTTAADGTYAEGKEIPVNVSFSKKVVVTGSPILWLNTTPARYAVYASGSGTNVLTFNYVVQLGDTAARLSNVGPTALNSSSGTIRTVAGVNAILTLPAASAAGALGSVSNIVVDGSLKATATGFGTTDLNAPKIASAVRKVTVTFNAPVTGFTASDVKLYYQGRPVSMAGTKVTGSGTTYTITFGPSTSLSGLYRLDIGRLGTAITSDGLPMTKVSSLTWRK